MKGRGAQDNPHNRYSPVRIERFPAAGGDGNPQTEVFEVSARSLISVNSSPDVPFDYSINPYAGCEHGCIYCYARPSHAHHDLSPGLDFETKIFAKRNAAEVLRRELSRPSYGCKVIAIGGNTDPYQPAERRLQITRQLLEVCLEFSQPVTLITKSALIKRDVDLIGELAARRLASVAVSVTTLDAGLKRILEPRTASPGRRLRTLECLSAVGIPVSALMAPIIPRINDHEIEAVVRAAAEHGAGSAGYILLRLPGEVRELFEAWLERHFPERARAVVSQIRQSRGGKAYRSEFHERMRGTGIFADMIEARFAAARKRHGIATSTHRTKLDTTSFRVPGSGRQLSLF